MAVKNNCIKRVSLRLDQKGADTLAAKSAEAGLCEADYLRLLISQKPNDYPEIRKLVKELINEIKRIGVNINQIAHSHNMDIYHREDRDKLLAYMAKILDALDRTVKAIGDN